MSAIPRSIGRRGSWSARVRAGRAAGVRLLLCCSLLPGAALAAGTAAGDRPCPMAYHGAGRQAPGCTRPALEQCIEDGIEWARLDVRRTQDGESVLFGSDLLGLDAGEPTVLADLGLAELRRLDAGAWYARRYAGERVLSLREGLELARDRLSLCLDCRDADPVRVALEVRESGMAAQVMLLALPGELERVRAAAGETVALAARWPPGRPVEQWLAAVRPAVVEVEPAALTGELCSALHAHGVRVLALCTEPEWDRADRWAAASQAGADWIATGRPEELIAQRLAAVAKQLHVRMSLHRGASRYAPENTLPAFDLAVPLGANLVEFDIRGAADGVFYLLHDARLDRTTSGSGAIASVPSAEVERLDAGAWFGRPWVGTRVPRLDQFLERVPLDVELYVDAKAIAPGALARALAAAGMTERAVVYQGVEYLIELKAIEPRIRTLPPLGRPEELDAIVERLRPYAVDAAWTILSPALIERCHALGVRVFSDALGAHDTVEEHSRAIRWGIDVIQTDRPLCFLRAAAQLAGEGRQSSRDADVTTRGNGQRFSD